MTSDHRTVPRFVFAGLARFVGGWDGGPEEKETSDSRLAGNVDFDDSNKIKDNSFRLFVATRGACRLGRQSHAMNLARPASRGQWCEKRVAGGPGVWGAKDCRQVLG